MDVLTGALLAAAVAWGSLLIAARLPLERALDLRFVRWGGGASLMVAAASLVVPAVPGAAAPAVLALGFAAGFARGPLVAGR